MSDHARRRSRRLAMPWPLPMAALLSGLLSLSGCGGDILAGGGIGGSGYVAGPIESLGSVVVQGTRFDTSEATIVVNGNAADTDLLTVGMYVGVYGTIDEDGTTGVATRIEFEETVSGPITSVSDDRQHLVVLDQEVRIEPSTRLWRLDLDELEPGLVVTVSGVRNGDDEVVATLLARRPRARGCRVLGEVAQLSADGASFTIGQLRVDASAAAMDDGPLVEGDNVSVLAKTCETEGPLAALSVRRLDASRPPPPGPARNVLVYVIELLGDGRFRVVVPGSPPFVVQTSPRTAFEGGSAGDLSRNVRVWVIGRLHDDGVLHAWRIVFLDG